MPLRTGVPRSTHQWLKPLYNYLDKGVQVIFPSGASGAPNAAWLGQNVPQTQVGNASGAVGLYGFTGLAQIATGGLGNSSTFPTYMGQSGWGATGMGNSGLYTFMSHYADNGGSGSWVTFGDVVIALKNAGILKQS